MMNRRGKLRYRLTVAIVAPLLGMALFATNNQPAHACDFDVPPPPEDAMEEATAVFSGEVREMVEHGSEPDQVYQVHFDVSRVWKGVSSESVVVETHQHEASCGYPFEEGERYLVYAHGEPDELETALYHRTTPWSSADEDLDALGEGTAIELVLPDEPAPGESGSVNPLLFAGVVIVISVATGIVILLRRARAAAKLEEVD